MIDLTGRGGAAEGLRAGLLLLAALGVVGCALALAYERHWLSAWQFAPWITLGVVIVAGAALIVRPAAGTVWLARTVAVLALVSGAIGVWQHIDANYAAASPAAQDSDGHGHSHGNEPDTTGPSLGDVVSGAAGHAPVPSALAIAPVGLALGLATIGLSSRRRPPEG